LKRLVLDTNLLVLFIVGNADIRRVGARRTEAFTAEHFNKLNEIAGSHKAHVSTPNVLTEASNLIGAADQELAKGAARLLAEYISRLDEIYEPSSKLIRGPLYARHGLADASLAVLAVNGDRVLTADGPLYGIMSGHGILVENFTHLISYD